MIPISDAPPKGVVDRRDGNTKGECGITTTSCLFCKDQIAGSSEYVSRHDQMKWASKEGCQIATCPFWETPDCFAEKSFKIGNSFTDPKTNCPVWNYRKETGEWKTFLP